MDAATVVTPPYVAGPLRLEPFRALRLIPSRIGDPSTGRAFARPYKDVAGRLTRWQRRGFLTRDSAPALYLHEYTSGGISVRGLVGLLDVSHRATAPADRAIFPHEGIHPVQADELADRMAEMQLNPAPILLVHRASNPLRAMLIEVAAAAPDHAFTDRSEQRHRIWAIRDPELLTRIAGELAPARAVIADGHHRYAAYLRLQRRQPGGPFDCGLAMLVDQGATPLFLGAIHRTITGTSLEDLRDSAATLGLDFELTDRPTAVGALGPAHLVATDGDRWAVITLANTDARPAVEILHRDIVPELRHGPTAIRYHHSAEEALADLGKGDRDGAIAILVPAPTFDVVSQVAAEDRLLPEKATSFQPKPSLGVFIRSMADGHDGQS